MGRRWPIFFIRAASSPAHLKPPSRLFAEHLKNRRSGWPWIMPPPEVKLSYGVRGSPKGEVMSKPEEIRERE